MRQLGIDGEMRVFPEPPGSYLRDEIKARGVTQRAVANDTGIPEQTISHILAGRRRITPIMAIRLGAYLGTSPELWVNLQARFDNGLAHFELALHRESVRRAVLDAARQQSGLAPGPLRGE